MSAQPDIVEIRQSIVAHARVVMRVVEMADVSRYDDLSWAEQFTLRMVQVHYLNRMLGLLALMPPDVTAEILGTSEKVELRPKNWTQKQRFLVNSHASGLLGRPLGLKLDRGQVAQRRVNAFAHVHVF